MECYLKITRTVPLTKRKPSLDLVCNGDFFSDYFDEGYDEPHLSKPTNYPTNQSSLHEKFTKLDNRPGFLNNRHISWRIN